ncbi:MAG: ATP-binding protein [Bacteroidota bacterium]
MQHQKAVITAAKEELEVAQAELKKVNRSLEQFAYVASHDLKEPLRMVDSYMRILERNMSKEVAESNKEFMWYITDGVSRMKKLIDDLLEYSRLGKDTNKQNTDLNTIMFQVISNLKVAMSSRDGAVHCDYLPTIFGSQREFTQLFQNLIANGLKFQRKDVTPQIAVGCEEHADHYLVSVADNGVGIPEEAQDRVFAIFERAHAKTEYEGTGIGLATCKKIVEHLGGRIWLESTLGQGTTFFFTLPKTKQPEPQQQVGIPATLA